MTVHKPLIVELPVDNRSAKTLQQTAYKDLTENPYAGLKVRITLEATDGAGQTGKSKPVTFTLPARVFTNPLARALVEQRQNLAIGDVAAVPRAQRTLDALTIAPERFYAGKSGVYTAIRAAYWGAAHRACAMRTLRASRICCGRRRWRSRKADWPRRPSSCGACSRCCRQALQSGAPQARDRPAAAALQAGARQISADAGAERRSPAISALPPNAKVLNQKDLQDLLNAIQQLAQTGARGQAAQMLAMLQSLLENLHMNAGKGGGQQSPQDKAAQRGGQETRRPDGQTARTARQDLSPGPGRRQLPKDRTARAWPSSRASSRTN